MQRWHSQAAVFLFLFLGAGSGELQSQQIALSEHGRRALATAPGSWQREETEHFVLFYANRFVGAPVGVEAEFYYRVIAADLGIQDAVAGSDAAKGHIYIFETAEAWARFVGAASLEAWTGAVNIGNDLFLPRYPQYKFKGSSLGHEIAHLIVHRHLGRLPLWLSEGYAEDFAFRAYAAFFRARGYLAKPRAPAPVKLYPLAELVQLTAYPSVDRVVDFYRQSRLLVRFLHGAGKKVEFVNFLKASARGEPLESALWTSFRHWDSLDALERDFLKERSRWASAGAGEEGE